MNIAYHPRTLKFAGIILSTLLWLANSGNPSNAKTGAPFNGNCNECHNGSNPGNFNGDVEVDGLPGIIEPNTTYPLTITLTPTSGSPTRGGFQLVAVDGNNINCGDLTAGNAQSGTEMSGGREYLEHRSAKNFTGGGPASWSFNWKSPVSGVNGNTVKFYFIGNFCNGSGSAGDFPIATNLFVPFQPPPAITIEVFTINVLCFGANTGTAIVEVSGGTGNYTYSWTGGQTGQSAVNLSAGTYTVTVSDPGSSSTATAVAIITQPASALAAQTSVSNNITCNTPSATITASGSGGTPPYQYLWSNGASNSEAEVAFPGTYTVTITDDNGCTQTASGQVQQSIVPPVAVATGNTQGCGAASTTVSGDGSSFGPNFYYLWTAPAGGTILSGENSIVATVNGSGVYTLEITNLSNGCTASATATVTTTSAPGVTATGTTLNCANPAGTISASSAGSGITYAWTGPNGFSSALPMAPVTETGTYTVVVTSTATGCTSSATATVTGNFVLPQVSISTTPATCATPFSATATSATGATFTWSGNGFSSTQATVNLPENANPYTLVVTGSNGCSISTSVAWSGSTTPPVVTVSGGMLTCAATTTTITATSNVSSAYVWSGPGIVSGSASAVTTVNAPGVYTVTVTNTNTTCSATQTYLVTQDIAPPAAIIVAPPSFNCTNAPVTLNGTPSSQGGTYTYLWTGPAIISGATTLMPVISSPGTYTLKVTNTSNGCTATANAVVTQNSPATVSFSNVVNVACPGANTGSLTASGNGGAGGFSFLWSNGTTTATAGMLGAGAYSVTATDASGCTAAGLTMITEPPTLAPNATATSETAVGANDGTATAVAAGGTTGGSGYLYVWSTSATTSAISGLAPGAYTVTVTDANGCTAAQTVSVNAFNCAFSASLMAGNITCNGAGNGSISSVLVNPTDPVEYVWSIGASTSSIANLFPGTYTVTLTDAANCTVVASAAITQPTAVSVGASATGITGVGLMDGTATASPTGGTGAFTYLWSTGGSTASITGLTNGPYTVTVSDANGCTAQQTVFVQAFNCTTVAIFNITNVSCAGQSNGTVTAELVNGVDPITYAWNTGAMDNTIVGLGAGTYTVTMTDITGCQEIATATVTEPVALVAETAFIQHVVCDNDNSGFAVFNISGGGTPPYTYTFPGNGSPLLGAGTYTVTVTNSAGCTTTTPFEILAIDTLAPVAHCPANAAFCDSGSAYSYNQPTATDNCVGGTINFQLLSGISSGSFFPPGVNTQVFRATDAAGNSQTCSFTVTVYPAPDIALVSAMDDINGQGLGAIDISPLGGVTPYTYVWTMNNVFFADTEDISNLMEGSYVLTATDANGCVVTTSPFIVHNKLVSTVMPFGENGITVMPNPAGEYLFINTNTVRPQSLVFYDNTGRLVLSEEHLQAPVRIDIHALAAGMYQILLTDEAGDRYFGRVIKQ